MFPGNTGDPGAFTEIVTVVRDKFRLAKMVMVGDRGMITTARIAAMNQRDDGTQRPDADTYEWITALRAPAIRKLMADDGPLQLSLFDQQDLAEITSEDFPGERLVACRNPVLAADRARTREDSWPPPRSCSPPSSPGSRPPPAGRRRNRGRGRQGDHQYKTGKHFAVTITDTTLAVARKQTRSTPKPPWTGSTCCAPRSPPPSSTRPPWSPPTRTSNTWNGLPAVAGVQGIGQGPGDDRAGWQDGLVVDQDDGVGDVRAGHHTA